MNGSPKVQPTHQSRQAVIYIRQSDPKQVQRNRESGHNQRALRERVLELGWKKNQITLVEGDQGRSAKHAAGRDGFQKLVADVGLRKVGIIVGYEVSRLSRNCADWYRLLELCAIFDTLLADADGVYNPRDFNDRLLLGLKGAMSEAELHSLRLRLDAGRLSKARRGELTQHIPTGLVRDQDKNVHFDADISVEQRIRLVFHKFKELGSAQKVLSLSCATGGVGTGISQGNPNLDGPGLHYISRSGVSRSGMFSFNAARILACSGLGRATRRRASFRPSVVSKRMSPIRTSPNCRRMTSGVIGRGLGEALGRRRSGLRISVSSPACLDK